MWPKIPGFPGEVRALVAELVGGMRSVFGDRIEGVYLFGSLLAGDFDATSSDIDLVVALASDVNDRELGKLGRMHDAFARAHPKWADRVDASYLSVDALRSFRERESPIVVISPGEPLHRQQTTPGWIMNWHRVREEGVAVLGPTPRSLIAATTRGEFLAAVRVHMNEMLWRVGHSDAAGIVPYAVLTACRALYSAHHGGRQASKRRAAVWASDHFPEWAALIRGALTRRSAPRVVEPTGAEERDPALSFVGFAVRELARAVPPEEDDL